MRPGLHLTSTEAQIYAMKEWHTITIDQALTIYRERPMRCSACGGAVKPHKAGDNGMQAHFEHKHRHAGCKYSVAWDGAERPHPRQVRA